MSKGLCECTIALMQKGHLAETAVASTGLVEMQSGKVYNGKGKMRGSQHEGTCGVTVPDGGGVFVIQGALVQVLHPVLLRPVGGGQMPDHHLQQRL